MSTMNYDDPRIEAMARAWCNVLTRDPDELSKSGPLWRGYAPLMGLLLEAAEGVMAEEANNNRWLWRR